MASATRRMASIAVAIALCGTATAAQAVTEIAWWHSMTGKLNDKVNEIAAKFNASQKDYKITPVYKGQYDESMTAAIAAYVESSRTRAERRRILDMATFFQPKRRGRTIDQGIDVRSS